MSAPKRPRTATPPKKQRQTLSTPEKSRSTISCRLTKKTRISFELTNEQRQRVEAKKEEVGRGKQGNAGRVNYDRAPSQRPCSFCKAPRHSRPWEYRSAGSPVLKKTIGSSCYPSIHACASLCLGTRSYEVLSELPDVLDIVLDASRHHMARLNAQGCGKCTCFLCSG